MPSIHTRRAWMLNRDAEQGPLSQDERERAHALSTRLRQELITLLEELSRSGASSLSLARDLAIDRNLCRRLCSSLETGPDWIEMLRRLPGPESLRAFVKASARRGSTPNSRNLLLAAIEQFQVLIWELAATQARLNQRLLLTRNAKAFHFEHGHTHEPATQEARDLFDVACKIKKSWMEKRIMLTLTYPSPRGGHLVNTGIVGYHGLHAQNTPLPLISRSTHLMGPKRETHEELTATQNVPRSEKQTDQLLPGAMLDFCSRPLPKITVDNSRPEDVVRLVDTSNSGAQGADLFFLFGHDLETPYFDDPNEPQYLKIIQPLRTPVKFLHTDMLIHKDIKTIGTGEVRALQLFNQRPHNDIRRHWSETLPGELQLEHLGTGPDVMEAMNASIWTRYRELCESIFNNLKLDPNDFVGYRYQTPYPYWGATYISAMEFQLSPKHPASA